MSKSHELFHQAEISSDPQLRKMRARQAERSAQDAQHLGKDDRFSADQQELTHTAVLGYN